MKKTTLVASMMVGMSILGLGQQVLAADIDGQSSTEIEINGRIGKLDNTDPEEEIPEGSDEWINVTLPTETAFHTTTASEHKAIDSAVYTIENKSGRGVQISLSKVIGEQALVNDLTIKGTVNHPAPVVLAPVKLVAETEIVDLTNSGAWMTLGNSEGKLNVVSDLAGTHGKTATFSYGGTTVEDLLSTIEGDAAAENYVLTMKFEAIQADGVTVGM